MIIGAYEKFNIGQIVDNQINDYNDIIHDSQPMMILREVSKQDWINAVLSENPNGVLFPEPLYFYEVSID